MNEKIKKFPKSETPPEILWECGACKHKITEDLNPTKAGHNRVLPMNLGGIMIYVCPSCFTLQLPEEVFEDILKKAESKIITPT